jgi:hypothetical protein
MRLPPDDLALSAAACRALAQRYRDNATKYEDGTLKDATLQRARHAERLAQFFERERERDLERSSYELSGSRSQSRSDEHREPSPLRQ